MRGQKIFVLLAAAACLGAPEAIALYAEQGRRFAIGANFKF